MHHIKKDQRPIISKSILKYALYESSEPMNDERPTFSKSEMSFMIELVSDNEELEKKLTSKGKHTITLESLNLYLDCIDKASDILSFEDKLFAVKTFVNDYEIDTLNFNINKIGIHQNGIEGIDLKNINKHQPGFKCKKMTPLLLALSKIYGFRDFYDEEEKFNTILTLINNGSNPSIHRTTTIPMKNSEGWYVNEKYPQTPLLEALTSFGNSIRCLYLVYLFHKMGGSLTEKGWASNNVDIPINLAIKYKKLDLIKFLPLESNEDLVKYAITKYNEFEVIKYLYEKLYPGDIIPDNIIDYFLLSCAYYKLDTVNFFIEKCKLKAEHILKSDNKYKADNFWSRNVISKGLYRNLSSWGSGSSKIRDYLWSLNPYPNYRSEYGYGYLYHCKDDEFSKKIIETGKAFKTQDNTRLLFEYIRDKNLELLEELLKNDTLVVLSRNSTNETPLTRACFWLRDYSGYWPVMELLYKYGADINAVNKWGENIVNICSARGHLKELKIIVEEWGALLTKPPNVEKWRNPLEEAKEYGRMKVVEYLTPLMMNNDNTIFNENDIRVENNIKTEDDINDNIIFNENDIKNVKL